MDIIFEKFGENGLIAKFDGKLNIETANQFSFLIKDAVDKDNINDLIIDFEKISYISSIGIRVLIDLDHKMTPPKSFAIRNLNEQVIESLRMTGVDRYLKIQ